MTSIPDGFLEGSVYKDPVFVGAKYKIDTGFRFDPGGGHEYGIYVTPVSRYARLYGDIAEGLVNFKNPLIVEGKHEISPTNLKKADIDRLKAQGYDAIVVTGSTLGKATEFVLFRSRQFFIFKGNR